MIYPDPLSEKGISRYSLELIENIGKEGFLLDKITYFQGKPLSLFKKVNLIKKYDIIHIQHEYNLLGYFGIPFFVLFSYLNLFKKKKLIITMHTVLSQKEKLQGNKIKNYLRKIFYILKNKLIGISSEKVIVHSEHFKKILINEYGFNSKKIEVIPHSIVENINIPSKSSSRKDLNLSGNVYLLIGTLIPDHGHDIILKQAKEIGKTILIATNPSKINFRNEKKIKDYLELNKKIINSKKIQNLVRLDLGEISNEKWWKYFSASDLILLPYRGGIGSGIFSDAMIAKKPVVSSNGPYFKEISKLYHCIEMAKNENDFGRAIKNAMKKDNYHKMVKESYRYSSENSLPSISKKYKALYLSLK